MMGHWVSFIDHRSSSLLYSNFINQLPVVAFGGNLYGVYLQSAGTVFAVATLDPTTLQPATNTTSFPITSGMY